MSSSTDYWHHKLYAFAILLLIVGGANVGLVALTGKDYVTALTGATFANAIFLAVGIAAFSLALFRDVYLPFLGASVVPCSALKPSAPDGADFEVKILAEPGQKVLYWAAEPGTEHLQKLPDWRQAYLDFKNAGVAVADETRHASLRVRKPQPYNVPIKGDLSAHIHYRVCMNGGFIGPVQTVSLNGAEWFENVPDLITAATPSTPMKYNTVTTVPSSGTEGFANVSGKNLPPAMTGENFTDIPSAAQMDKLKANALSVLVANAPMKEGFQNNVRRQETNAPADVSTGFDYVKPDSALAEVNRVAADTLKNSLMPQTGGFDESNKGEGTSIAWAFAPTPFN